MVLETLMYLAIAMLIFFVLLFFPFLIPPYKISPSLDEQIREYIRKNQTKNNKTDYKAEISVQSDSSNTELSVQNKFGNNCKAEEYSEASDTKRGEQFVNPSFCVRCIGEIIIIHKQEKCCDSNDRLKSHEGVIEDNHSNCNTCESKNNPLKCAIYAKTVREDINTCIQKRECNSDRD